MEENHKKAIQNNYELLKNSIESVPLADHLFSRGKVTKEQHDIILDINEKRTNTAGNRKCLDIIMQSGPDAYECLREFLKSDSARHFILEKLDKEMVEDIRVVIFGKTGVGKSLLGNKILGQNVFNSRGGAQSVTKESMQGERMIDTNCKLILVDTPGLFDTETKHNMETAKILASTVKETKPGPHVFIFVISISNRFTTEEQAAIEFLKDLFGRNVTDYLIIVFTGKDTLDFDNIDFEAYIDNAGDDLKYIVSQSQGKMTINNRASDEEVTKSVDGLLQMIRYLYLKNNKKHYTDELLTEAEQQFLDKQLKQGEEHNRREQELKDRVKTLEEEKEQHMIEIKEYKDKHNLTNEYLHDDIEKLKCKIQKAVKKAENKIEPLFKEKKKLEAELKKKTMNGTSSNDQSKMRQIQTLVDDIKQKGELIEKMRNEIAKNNEDLINIKKKQEESNKKSKCTLQ